MAKIKIPLVLHKFIDPVNASSSNVTHISKVNSPANTNGLRLSVNRNLVNLSRNDCNELVEDAKLAGFGIGAIVARRIKNSAVYCSQWGYVSSLYRFPPHDPAREYCPLEVHWFTTNARDKWWPEELYLIHQSLDDAVLLTILESQDED